MYNKSLSRTPRGLVSRVRYQGRRQSALRSALLPALLFNGNLSPRIINKTKNEKTKSRSNLTYSRHRRSWQNLPLVLMRREQSPTFLRWLPQRHRCHTSRIRRRERRHRLFLRLQAERQRGSLRWLPQSTYLRIIAASSTSSCEAVTPGSAE